MPPLLALFLFTIFVLFLLRLDKKQNPNSSLSLWVPTFWFLLTSSKGLGFWFDSGSGSLDEGSILDRRVLILLLCIGLLIIKKRNINIINSLRLNTSLILLLVFTFISISWSDMPFISFKRWVKFLLPIVMALIIASEGDPRQALQSIFRRMIYVHVPFSLMLIKYYPHFGRQYTKWEGDIMWVGVCSQKNGLAYICSFALFYLIWKYIRILKGRDTTAVWYQVYVETFIAFLAFWLFMGPNRTLTYSATSMAALTIGLVSLIGLLWLKKHNIIISSNTFMILIIAIIIYGTVTAFIGALAFFDPSTVLNRDETLTGRSDIWAMLVPFAMAKPILGYGVGGFWNDSMLDTIGYGAHNGYLDTILDFGFIGLFLFSIFLISNCRKAQKLMIWDLDWGILWFCILLMTMIRNITESSIKSFNYTSISILIFLMISFTLKDSKQEESIKLAPFL